MTSYLHFRVLMIATAMLVATNQANAWTWGKCNGQNVVWSSEEAKLRASSIGFPSGSSWRTELAYVRDQWNRGPSQMNYVIQWNESSVGENNGQSEVWWTSSLSDPAVVKRWVDGSCKIVETDVIFKNTVSYSTSHTKTSLTPYGGSGRPFQTTAMHEFGHVQGLNHTTNTYSIMGEDWDHIHARGSTANAYPGEDALAGSVSVYGAVSGTLTDVGATHWRRTGASGGYSTHARTRVFDSSGNELSKLSGSEPVYKVSKGQSVQVEMGWENLGKTSPVTANAGFYLSTNDYISTSDRLLKTIGIRVSRDKVAWTRTSVTVPSDLSSGTTYWIGAYYDHDNRVSEIDGGNNTAYVGIKIN